MSSAHSARVFSAGGHCFTWVEVVEWARARGELAALRGRVVALLARERELAAAGALPAAAGVQAAADNFRDRHNLLTADELEEWLARHDVTRGSVSGLGDGLHWPGPKGITNAPWKPK